MNNSKTYLTNDGLYKLKQELDDLTNNQRPQLAKRLREAIKMGDLKENADYIAAKEDQAFIEGRILEIQDMISSSIIIDPKTNTQEVSIGSQVIIKENNKSDNTEKYTLVGSAEADPTAGLISHESPIGQALIGKSIGDTVEVNTPGGALSFKIIKIQ